MTCDCKGTEQTCNLCQADGSITGEVVSEPLVPLQSDLSAEVGWREMSRKLCDALESVLYEDSDKPDLRKTVDRVIACEVLYIVRTELMRQTQHQTEEAGTADERTAEQQTIGLTPKTEEFQ